MVISSPAINDRTVYIGSNDGNVYALNSTTGSLIWEFYMGGPVESSATIDNNYNSLYVGGDNGQFSCLDSRNGETQMVNPNRFSHKINCRYFWK